MPLPMLPPKKPTLPVLGKPKPALPSLKPKLPFALKAVPMKHFIIRLDGREVGRLEAVDVRAAIREANRRWNPHHQVVLSLLRFL